MGLELAKAFIRVRADASQVPGDLNKAKPGATAAASKMGAAIGGAMAAAFGARALLAIGQESIALAEVQINAQQRLAATIEATGAAAGFSAKELQNWASEMQGLTTFGDEVILEAGAKLLTFKSIAGDVFERTLQAAMDLSAVGFGGLNETVLQLGKALEDPAIGMSALTRVGVTFSEQQKEQIKNLTKEGKLREAQVLLLKTVEGQVKGVAKAMAETPVGKLQQAKNLLGDTKEILGKALIPLQQKFVEVTLKLIEGLVFVSKVFKANNKLLLKTVIAVSAVAAAILVVQAAIKAAAIAQAIFMALGGPVAWGVIAAGAVVAAAAIWGIHAALKSTEDAAKGAMGKLEGVAVTAEKAANATEKLASAAKGLVVTIKEMGEAEIFKEETRLKKRIMLLKEKQKSSFMLIPQSPMFAPARKAQVERLDAIDKEIAEAEKQLGETRGARKTEFIPGQPNPFEMLGDPALRAGIDAAGEALQETVKRMEELREEGRALAKVLRTPAEVLKDELNRIDRLLAADAISEQMADRAKKEAAKKAMGRPSETRPRFADISQVGRIIQERLFKGKQDKQAEMVAQQREGNKIQKKILKAVQDHDDGGLIAGNN